jgi:hypothetical protein
MGEARVTIEVRARGEGTLVHIHERAVSGPGRWLSLVVDPLLHWRNRETLRRLAYLAEGGAGRAIG